MDKDLFLKMIDAGIKGNSLPKEDLDKEFLGCAKEQTFLAYLYPVFKDDKYKKYYIQSYLVHEAFNKIRNKLDNILNENKIKHIYLKGEVMKPLYNDPNLRMQGDIDVIVSKEDFNKAKDVLINNGFILDDEGKCAHHIGFKYEGLEIELHRSLFDDGENKDLDIYFSDIFTDCNLIEGYAYRLNPNKELVYILCHYAKHLRIGSGLRSLCDIYLLLNKFDIDLDRLNKDLETLNLTKFFNTILNELNIIFGYNKLPYKEDNKLAHELIDYSLKAGIHGFGQGNDLMTNRIENESEGNKLNFLLKRLFVPVRTLFLLYPWTKSIILIPLGYIVRFFYLVFKRSSKLKEVVTSTPTKESMFTRLGLK